jgi:hypothetical protein
MGITINAQKTRPARESIDMEKGAPESGRSLTYFQPAQGPTTGKHDRDIIEPVCTRREMDTRSIFPDSHPYAIPTVSSR